jgi:hypothetical protein
MICPSCEGRELEQDMVDVGVGEVPCGPRGCPDCGWVEGEPVPTRVDLFRALAEFEGYALVMSSVYEAAVHWRRTVKLTSSVPETNALIVACDAAIVVEDNALAAEAKKL